MLLDRKVLSFTVLLESTVKTISFATKSCLFKSHLEISASASPLESALLFKSFFEKLAFLLFRVLSYAISTTLLKYSPIHPSKGTHPLVF